MSLENSELTQYLNAVQGVLGKFDTVDLLQGLAALQLYGPAQANLLRLEAGVHVVAASRLRSTGKKKVPPQKYHQTVLEFLSGLAPLEEPIENCFVEEIPYIGGAFKVTSGASSRTIFELKLILHALEVSRGRGMDESIYQYCSRIAGAGLVASDYFISRAGLTRKSLGSTISSQVEMCPMEELTRLKKSVRTNVTLLINELEKLRLKPDHLSPFITKSVNLEQYDLEDGCLLRRPIFAFKGDYMMAIPSAIPAATRYHLLNAIPLQELEKFSSAFADVTWARVRKALKVLGTIEVHSLERQDDVGFHEQMGLFRYDVDKVICAYLITEDVSKRSADRLFPNISFPGLETRLKEAEHYAKQACMSQPIPSECLMLVLVQTTGGTVAQKLETSDDEVFDGLMITPEELECIARSLPGNPQVLRQFVLAEKRLSRTTKVYPTSMLDRFAVFKSCGFSFYCNDDEKPTLMVMPIGLGGDLRREVAEKRDFHGVASPSGFLPIALKEEDSAFPLYFAPGFEGIALMLSGNPNVWFIAVTENDNSLDVCEFLAYWFWQARDHLEKLLQKLSDGKDYVTVMVEASGTVGAADDCQPDNLLSVELDWDQQSLTVNFNMDQHSVFWGADNTGERAVLRRLIGSISKLLPRVLGDVDEIVEAIAPLGPKKQILALPARIEFLNDHLPEPLRVSDYDVNILLDEIGDYLALKGWTVGRLSKEKACELYNRAVVPFLTSELTAFLAPLDPTQTLQHLLAFSEAGLVRENQLELTMPTRIACFGDEVFGQLRQEQTENMRANSALRFLIEFATAQPPQGSGPLSQATLDRIVAVCHLIQNFGFESDLTFHNLVDLEVSILPSRRVGRNVDDWERALDQFRDIFIANRAVSSLSGFSRHWNENSAPPPAFADLDEAFELETGYPLTQWLEFFQGALLASENEPGGIFDGERREFLDLVGKHTTLDRSAAEHMLLELSIGPRPTFIPKGNDNVHYVPWRFNRDFSLLRRPILFRGDSHLLCGARHCIVAADYLIHLCTSGRFRAKDDGPVKKWISEHQKVLSDEFVDEILGIFQDRYGCDSTRKEFKKVGGQRIGMPEKDLGDVDVLAIDEENQVIWLVECKDWRSAGTPHELANEVKRLLDVEDGALEKHSRRRYWLNEHLELLIADLGLDQRTVWVLKPLLVVSHALITPLLRTTEYEVIRKAELPDYLNRFGRPG